MPGKQKLKKPPEWRPGTTPKFKPHHAVVRYRDPDIKAYLGVRYLDGHTHARFVAHPECCPICQRLDGRIQRLVTILNWKYRTAHCNCRCNWETGVMKGGKFVAKSLEVAPLDETLIDIEKAQREGLVKKKIPVRRGGKTIYQERWVRAEHVPKHERKPGVVEPPEDKPKKKPSQIIKDGYDKMPAEAKQRLTEHSKDIAPLKEGQSKKIGNADVTALQGGYYGVKVAGERLLVHGVKAASIVADYAGLISASYAATIAGDVEGRGIRGKETLGARQKAARVEARQKQAQAKREQKRKERAAEGKE